MKNVYVVYAIMDLTIRKPGIFFKGEPETAHVGYCKHYVFASSEQEAIEKYSERYNYKRNTVPGMLKLDYCSDNYNYDSHVDQINDIYPVALISPTVPTSALFENMFCEDFKEWFHSTN